jgi:23S rRNA (cytidine1920-2'-O)/16S rRNA (cytidine1409-2'-O)-methyltransferase
VRVIEMPRFVSRGGEKLEAALDGFGVAVQGRRCLDVGASTGGFTDCLLQRGAATVVAVDVGHGQLHPRLRTDPRVLVCERTNIRTVSLRDIGGSPFEVLVADVSFISLTAVIPVLVGPLAADGADVILLVKPQFEAGRAEASRGRGVIRDPAVRAAALERVASAAEGAGASIMGTMQSPISGRAGNVELLFYARVLRQPAAPAPTSGRGDASRTTGTPGAGRPR